MAIQYRSIDDLSRVVRSRLDLVPVDIDLVVGVPRSGMLPAAIIALYRNLKVCSIEEYLRDIPLNSGSTRSARFGSLCKPSDARRVLVVDDSISSGGSMTKVRERLAARHDVEIFYCAIYARPDTQYQVDISFEAIPHPRIFEWNLFHHPVLSKCCLEIDGVLSTLQQAGRQDGNRIETAPCLIVPSHRIGHIVTAQLERFRPQTVAWLEHHGIEFGELHMMDQSEPASEDAAAAFKAEIYHKIAKSILFIEADGDQAAKIADRSGKPVLSMADQELCQPGLSVRSLRRKGRSVLGHIVRKLGLKREQAVR